MFATHLLRDLGLKSAVTWSGRDRGRSSADSLGGCRPLGQSALQDGAEEATGDILGAGR